MHISSDQKFSFRRPFIPQKVKKKPTLQEMASKGLNPNSSAVRRIMKELKELELNPSSEYTASPLEQNIFEWHFTIRGPEDTSFAGGRYHGRILLPSEYPFKPPDIMLITPNGRFEEKKKICLSISGFHPESWQPSWSIRMILLALISLFPTPAEGAIGSIDLPDEIRRKLASESLNWACDVCGANSMSSLPKETKITESEKLLQNSMVSKIQFGVRKDRIPEEEEESKGVDPDDQANIYQEPVENSRIDHDDSKDDEKREERTVEESFAPAQNVREHRDASEISVNPKSELYFSAASLCFLFIIVSILLKKLLLKFSYKEEDISHHFN